MAAQINGDIKKVIRKTAVDLYKNIALRTPVDTGRARANWSIDTNYNPSTQSYNFGQNADAQSSQVIQTKAESFASQEYQFEPITIYNNVEYIGYLEDGSSQQAPNGMVEVSLNEAAAHLTQSLRQYS
jgi:hypothetical protein